MASSRKRAEELFAFALTEWDSNPAHPSPGGLFWVRQGAGRGLTDHTRHTISNAPNAELGFHLHELTGSAAFDGEGEHIGARDIYEWVNDALDESKATIEPATGLYFDNMQIDGNVDRTPWTYNQGVMIGANVLLHRLAGGSEPQYVSRAETVARKALAHFDGKYVTQPESSTRSSFVTCCCSMNQAATPRSSRASSLRSAPTPTMLGRRDATAMTSSPRGRRRSSSTQQ